MNTATALSLQAIRRCAGGTSRCCGWCPRGADQEAGGVFQLADDTAHSVGTDSIHDQKHAASMAVSKRFLAG